MSLLKNNFVFFMFILGLVFVASEDYHQFYEDILKYHNEYRKTLLLSELILDVTMCQEAMKCAENYENAIDPKRNFNVNVFLEEDISKLNAKNVVDTWCKEVSNIYIMWTNTQKLGVAVLQKESHVVIVATYYPRT